MRFYVVFIAVVGLTLLSGCSAMYIALNMDITNNSGAKSILDTTSFLFTAGMGTIIGLLAGSKLSE